MMKKMMIVLAVLAFCGASLITMTSCAKKGIVSEEPVKPAPPVVKEVTPPAPPVQPAPDDDNLADLERQRKQLLMEVQAFESGHVYFDYDKSELKPEARAILDKKATWLKAHTDYSVRIEGHCDERGTSEYNLALGERRANAAMKYLNAVGVSSGRISTVSYGEERPADPGHSEEAWAKNRRDEFKVTE